MGDALYADNPVDRGHIARRADLTWGDEAEAKQANSDSFYFTNISPQMDDFNQAARAGVWGRLEDAVYEEVDVDRLRLSVFGGPVLGADDRLYRSIRVPREFWKVIAFVDAGTLKARGFLLTQALDRLGVLELTEFRPYQTSLASLAERTGIVFPESLLAADLPAQQSFGAPRPVRRLDDIVW